MHQVHVLHKASGKWYEMQDLHVTEILPQMITLTEAYIQVQLTNIPSLNNCMYIEGDAERKTYLRQFTSSPPPCCAPLLLLKRE